MQTTVNISAEKFDAFIFDLDGVVTETAKIHARAWKKTFDAFLQNRQENGNEFRPFDIKTDYARYVDGIPRYDGVKNFLESRDIHLPYGSPDDPPEKQTICGIGNKKNELFQELMNEDTIFVYDSTIELIHELRRKKIGTGIVSSSKNCARVLDIANIRQLFDTKIDGVDSQRLNLNGKPEPDIFIAAARNLNADPARTAVVEDAVFGVEAGRKGNFGLVIGVDRSDHAGELKDHGADVVVPDLSKIHIQD